MSRIAHKPLFLCALVLIAINCSREDQDLVSTDETQREYPSQEGWNSEIRVSNAGRLQAIVKYGHMMKFDNRKVFEFDEGVEVDFFDREGNHTSNLTSDAGEYHEGTEDVFGTGNVVVVSDSGLTLHTERLRWDNRREKIISDTLVMLTTPDYDTLFGIGFESNADLSRRVIRQPWGVTSEGVDFEKIEESFLKSSFPDSLPKNDSTTVQEE